MNLVEAKERDKYRRMWERAEYRRYSPGLEAASRAFKQMRAGQTLYDLGCGTGRAGDYFHANGMDVVLVDFAPNANESKLPFVEACLWRMELPRRDWGFCADVMEHIPPEHVEAVLERIAACCSNVYFQIHTEQDGCGRLIGETLHLTVQEPAWWFEKLRKYFVLEGHGKSRHRVETWGRVLDHKEQ